MQKLIFLDIDGVLATPKFTKDGMWWINPEQVKLLKYIIDQTSAKIVLSSSWRNINVEETKIYMKEHDFSLFEEIIGVTIRAYQYIDRSKKIHLSIPRGVEIKQWLDTHIHSDNGVNWNRLELYKDYNYVIIDDDTDMLLEQKDNFVQCNSEVGLTQELVNKAIQILNN